MRLKTERDWGLVSSAISASRRLCHHDRPTGCGRSTTVGSEREWFDRQRSQFDPKPSPAALQSGHRNRLKPPFKLRQRGASFSSDWMPTTEGKDRAPPAARRHASTATATSVCSRPTHRCALRSPRWRRSRRPLRPASIAVPAVEPAHRRAARYAWAIPLARGWHFRQGVPQAHHCIKRNGTVAFGQGAC
jgi:hypothetical protein